MNPSNDFLHELGYLGFTMRFKRISDKLMHDGRNLYNSLDLDIEPNWYGVFMLLDYFHQLGVTEISDYLQLSHPSAISIINKMEAAGYVAGEKSTSDLRKRRIVLTKKAKEKLPQFKKLWSAGAESVRQLLHETNLFSDLGKMEKHFNQTGFRQRTLDKFYHQDADSEALKIVPFEDRYADDFTRINYEWLEMYFRVEHHDREMLDEPKSFIIDQGGQIFFALYNGIVVGVVALFPEGRDAYELSKMGVSPIYKGLGIGKKLVDHALEYARKEGKAKVVLESNRTLKPAIQLYHQIGFKEVSLDPNTPYERCDIRMEVVFDEKSGS